MAMLVQSVFNSSCDAEDAVRELRGLGILDTQFDRSVVTPRVPAAPELAKSSSGLLFAVGLGVVIGGTTGACISPLTAWLVNSPVAYLATPVIAGAIGGVVALMFGLMSSLVDHHPAQQSLVNLGAHSLLERDDLVSSGR